METIYLVVGSYCSDEGEFCHNVAAYGDKTTAENIANALDELANGVQSREGSVVANAMMAELVPEYTLPKDRYGVNYGTYYSVQPFKVNK